MFTKFKFTTRSMIFAVFLILSIIVAIAPTMYKAASRNPYNKCYDGMRWFHSHLRVKWTDIRSELAREKPSIQKLIPLIVDLTRHLGGHHRIEEGAVFPLLAQRLPQFAHRAEHEKEQQVMHRALTDLEGYAPYVLHRPSTWSKPEMSSLVDSLHREGLISSLGS
ncbi:uncharacterized protein L201_004567 [Kwoniella dendrophila CBS 6074]|uniref:Hemerythrin-like domain-containing protein n=1 Tax=Kwoniella dendrophila CBS 6074 TaxID=1295534 RepID=A0AAX4JW99_9TREE